MRSIRIILCFSLLVGYTNALTAQSFASQRRPLELEEQQNRVGKQVHRSYPKLHSALEDLIVTGSTSNVAPKKGLRLDGTRIQVIIKIINEGVKGEVEAVIETAGATNISSYGSLIQANVPLESLAVIADTAAIVSIRAPDFPWLGPIDGPPVPLVEKASAAYISEGILAMNADDWHNVGYLGQGVRVGVIDGGFSGWAGLVGTELPGNTYYENFSAFSPSSSAHGTACAEIISDVAPGIDALYLAEVGTIVDVAGAVDALVAEGVDVISMSLAFFGSSPGDGSGVLQGIIDDYVALGGVWVTSAGNQRLSHWQGYWADANQNYYLDFPHGFETNFLTSNGSSLAVIPAGTTITAFLTWNQWYAPVTDLDLHLYYWDGINPYVEVASSTNIQEGLAGDLPVESITISAPATGYYGLMVDWWGGTTAVDIEIFARPDVPLEARVSDGSIAVPSDALGSLTVAAVDAGSPFTLENYSARGPDNGTGGALYGGPLNPDIAGYANVSTASYGARSGGGSFNGTSAACPHAAGAAALVWSAFPSSSNTQIRSFLESNAVNLGPAGKDNDYGWGRLYLGSPPCSYSISPASTNAPAGGETGNVSVTASASCQWSASSNSAWIFVTSGSTGTGNGSVGYSVSANSSPSPRAGSITIAGKTFTVNQAGLSCSYSISPTSETFDAAGGAGSVSVTTSVGCQWSAVSNDAWINVTSGSPGSGSGSIDYSVETSESHSQRDGTITVAGLTFSVHQGANFDGEIFSDGFESGDVMGWSSAQGSTQ